VIRLMSGGSDTANLWLRFHTTPDGRAEVSTPHPLRLGLRLTKVEAVWLRSALGEWLNAKEGGAGGTQRPTSTPLRPPKHPRKHPPVEGVGHHGPVGSEGAAPRNPRKRRPGAKTKGTR
jgi:hypothetical protein